MPSSAVDGWSIRTSVRDFLKENFILGDGAALDDSASLVDSGIVDSTGVIELASFLEQRFSITIEEEDLVAENLDSVDRICLLVENRSARHCQ